MPQGMKARQRYILLRGRFAKMIRSDILLLLLLLLIHEPIAEGAVLWNGDLRGRSHEKEVPTNMKTVCSVHTEFFILEKYAI